MIAFLPLFTNNTLLKLNNVSNFFEHNVFDNPENHFDNWERKEVSLYLRGENSKDFFDLNHTGKVWLERNIKHEDHEYNINPKFDSFLKSETKKILSFVSEHIPIIPTHITLVNSTGPVPPHVDCGPAQRNLFHQGLDPSTIKILINPDDYDNTLYFKHRDEKIFLKKENLPKTTNVFAWSENKVPHGAIYKEGTNRILLNIFGILNKEKYKSLLEKSYSQYNKYAITIEEESD